MCSAAERPAGRATAQRVVPFRHSSPPEEDECWPDLHNLVGPNQVTVMRVPRPPPPSSATHSKWYGAARPTFPLVQTPGYLAGEYPGDFGFDPLGLAADGRLAKMFEAELLHARWAMLAVPGCLLPELLSLSGVDIGETVWWKARRASWKQRAPSACCAAAVRLVRATEAAWREEPHPFPLAGLHRWALQSLAGTLSTTWA